MADLQSQIRLGRPEDLYYYGSEDLRRQAIPTFQNTQFSQSINAGAGSGNFQVIFSPNNGVGHLILAAKLKAHAGVGMVPDYTNLAVSRGWLAELVDRVSYRVAGASQYWQTGRQIALANCLEASNPTSKQDMFGLSGVCNTTVSQFSQANNLYAYLYLNMPFNKPSAGVDAAKPLPTELMTSPLVLSIDLKPLQSIFSSAVALGSTAGAGQALESAYVQFQQIQAQDAGDLMKIDGDRSKMYSLPCKGFWTQQLDMPLATGAGNAGEFNLSLTGFQSGQLRNVLVALSDNADTNPASGAPFVKNDQVLALGTDYRLTFNGQVIHDYQGTSSVMWGLLNSDVPPSYDTIRLGLTAGVAPITTTSVRSDFTVFPMGQIEEANPHLLVNGRYMSNSIMNLRVKVPNPASSYTLHVCYLYNTVLAMAGGDASFLF